MSCSYLVMPKVASILLYGVNKRRYQASCQIEIHGGGRARIHTLNGRDFYKMIVEMSLAPFRELGIHTVEAEVEPGHIRLLRAALDGLASVTELYRFRYEHLTLCAIEIRDRTHIDTT